MYVFNILYAYTYEDISILFVVLSSSISACSLFPTFGVGLLDCKLNSSPRPELFSSPGLLLETPGSAFAETPWSAQLQRFLECPTQRAGVPNPESPWIAQTHNFPGVPNLRVSWSAQPQSLPGVPKESPWSAQPQRLPGVLNGANSSCKRILRKRI